jgi:hypothetical protein
MARDISMGPARASVKASTRPVISWGAVFGGAVVGLALFTLLSSLWLALAFESNTDVVRSNLAWFLGGSALGCLFLGGIITGYLTGIRSPGSGILHGWSLWGLLMIATIAIGIPSVLNIFGLDRVTTGLDTGNVGNVNALWATFWTILGGFVAAGLGGAIGGAMAREPGVVATSEADPTVVDVNDHDDDHDRDVQHARVS